MDNSELTEALDEMFSWKKDIDADVYMCTEAANDKVAEAFRKAVKMIIEEDK